MNESNENTEHVFRGRDVLTLQLLGAFFVGFGLLVWVGLFWDQPVEGRIVAACAGFVLLLAGAASLWIARKIASRKST